MSKGYIQDPTIRLKPSEKLCEFISSLGEEKSLPENILKIYQIYSKDKSSKGTTDKDIPLESFNEKEIEILKKLNKSTNLEFGQANSIESDSESDSDEESDEEIESLDSKPKNKHETKKLKEKQITKLKSTLTIDLKDLKWLNKAIKDRRDSDDKFDLYLHELIETSKLILPKNETIERNPVLEKRCAKLRLQQEQREYNAMTKNVDNARREIPEDSIASQSKFFHFHCFNESNFFLLLF